MSKVMTFLKNPRGRRSRKVRRVSARKHSVRATAKAARRRRRKVGPVRAVVQRKRRIRGAGVLQQGGAMARKRRRRRGNVARSNPPRRRSSRRRFRRNPVGAALKGVVPFVTDAAVGAVVSLGGIVTARKVRGLIGQQPGTMVAALVEAGVGVVGGLVLSRTVSQKIGADFARGGLLAPMMTLVQQARIPFISDSLGDDGFVLGDGLGAYIGDDDIAGYIGQGGAERVGDADFQSATAWNG